MTYYTRQDLPILGEAVQPLRPSALSETLLRNAWRAISTGLSTANHANFIA